MAWICGPAVSSYFALEHLVEEQSDHSPKTELPVGSDGLEGNTPSKIALYRADKAMLDTGLRHITLRAQVSLAAYPAREPLIGIARLDAQRKLRFSCVKGKTLTAVYAIVNTAVAEYKGLSYYPSRVRFLIEGKPLRNLANMDMRELFRPRYDTVVQHR